MLNSTNGKYLSDEWRRKRNVFLQDRRKATDAELSRYEIGTHEGTIAWMPDGFQIDTNPVDAYSEDKSKKIDRRTLPENGGYIG